MWDYIYFIAYLLNKKETEYTGIEFYVFNKIKEDDYTWVPIDRFLT